MLLKNRLLEILFLAFCSKNWSRPINVLFKKSLAQKSNIESPKYSNFSALLRATFKEIKKLAGLVIRFEKYYTRQTILDSRHFVQVNQNRN